MTRFDYRGSFVGVRPERWFHGEGFAFRANFVGEDLAPWLQDIPPFAPRAGEPYEAVVRCSPFVPVKPPIPAVLCLAIKIKDGCGPGQDQDLTFFSTLRWRHLRMVPWIRRHAKGTTFSSASAYRTKPPVPGARKVLFGLRFQHDPPQSGAETAFAELVCSLRPGISLDLLTAVAGDDWRRAGVLSDFQPDVPWGNAVRFRPGNTSEHLTLPWLGRWRDAIYKKRQTAPLEAVQPGEPLETA
jgi:hypothetical protein